MRDPLFTSQQDLLFVIVAALLEASLHSGSMPCLASLPPSSLTTPHPVFLSSSNSHLTLPLCCLCCRLIHPMPTMAGCCCVLGGWSWASLTSSSPLGLSSLSSLSHHPPQQRSVGRCVREEEDMVAIALASTQHHCGGEEGQAEQVRTGFYMIAVNYFNVCCCYFSNNSASCQKNNNRLLSVHIKLNSTCTDDCQLTN